MVITINVIYLQVWFKLFLNVLVKNKSFICFKHWQYKTTLPVKCYVRIFLVANLSRLDCCVQVASMDFWTWFYYFGSAYHSVYYAHSLSHSCLSFLLHFNWSGCLFWTNLCEDQRKFYYNIKAKGWKSYLCWSNLTNLYILPASCTTANNYWFLIKVHNWLKRVMDDTLQTMIQMQVGSKKYS